VDVVPREAGAPDFFHVAAKASNTGAFCRQTNFANTGGASSVLDVAVAKAIGEAIERYAAAIYDHEELPLSPQTTAPFRCVDPGEFAIHSAAQYAEPEFPWVPLDPLTPVRWTPAIDAATGETWHVPAAMVFMPYHYYEGTGDAPIVQPISTGLACHLSHSRAAISGICEVVERDAFTITWQARLARPHVRVETLSDRNFDLVQRFERTGGGVTLLDITLDSKVPTILAVLRSAAPACPALVVAAAADLDPEEAVRKSLEELAHTRRYSQQIKTRLPRLAPDASHRNVTDQLDHLNFWCDHSNADRAAFLLSSPARSDFEDIGSLVTGDDDRNLGVLVERIEATGHRVLLCDLTTPDIRNLGLSVIRALIPGYHPLFMGFALRALGGRRLWETPARIGSTSPDPDLGDNPLPHPYP
jgi:ribosomal protein S12 methylthiotransferase accessory factor